MKKKTIAFNTQSVTYYFDAGWEQLQKLVTQAQTVLITDENIFRKHKIRFKGWNTIVLKAGEPYKVQATVDAVIEQLIAMGADRQTTLVGVGGGVITDLTGYIAGVYLRGVSVGFVPTSLLAMVDAAIGGKNGIDVGSYKNMVGLIRQPSFLLFDYTWLQTLPLKEWQNGFAEIIKHACIKDPEMYAALQSKQLSVYQKKPDLMAALVERNVMIKTKLVQSDEFEKGDRKILNFGHTLGHAIENMYELSHGQAVSIGMAYAAILSQQLVGFKGTQSLIKLLGKYGLPGLVDFDARKALKILQKDKKKKGTGVDYILLENTGKAIIQHLSFDQLKEIFKQF